MSYTEIVCFKNNGDAESCTDIKNSWRGAMAIWNILEKKYLPQYRPSYIPKDIPDSMLEAYCGYKPSRCSAMMDRDAMKEIWNLFDKNNVSKVDRIVLGTTFDKMLVKKENFQEVIDAFNQFEGETSLKEQANVLKETLENDEIIAVGWNQTSVTQNQWTCHEFDKESEEYIPYNCLKSTEHYWLFDEMEKEGEN